MKKIIGCSLGGIGLLAAGILVIVQLSHPVEAARKQGEPIVVCGSHPIADSGDGSCFSTCGGEIPWPFQTANQVAELADGERYVLMGMVSVVRGDPSLIVDLEAHPWLANSRRRSGEGYPLLGMSQYWKKYAGKKIQLRATAYWTASDEGRITVMLESQSDPAVVTSEPAHKETYRSKR
jgi:hypothetical protein